MNDGELVPQNEDTARRSNRRSLMVIMVAILVLGIIPLVVALANRAG